MSESINIEELLKEYDKFQEKRTVNGYTAQELAELWGVSKNCVSIRLKKLIEDGFLVTMVGKRYIKRVDGQMQPVPVYQIKEPPKSKKK